MVTASLTLDSRVLQMLVTANVVPSSLIPFILMMEAILSSETSVLTIAIQYLLGNNILLRQYKEKIISLCSEKGKHC
jgi:hypothetical protein